MNIELLRIVGGIAGIGGLALGVFLILFRDVIQKKIFPKLTSEQAFRIIRTFMWLVFLIAVAGIVAWVIAPWVANTSQPAGGPPAQSMTTYALLLQKIESRDGSARDIANAILKDHGILEKSRIMVVHGPDIWLTTRKGAYRLRDGLPPRKFPERDTAVREIFKDKEGIWLLTDAGVFRILGDEAVLIPERDLPPDLGETPDQ